MLRERARRSTRHLSSALPGATFVTCAAPKRSVSFNYHAERSTVPEESYRSKWQPPSPEICDVPHRTRTANDDQVHLEEKATDGYATRQSATCDYKSVRPAGQLGQPFEARPRRETRVIELSCHPANDVGQRGQVSRVPTAAWLKFVLLAVLFRRDPTGRCLPGRLRHSRVETCESVAQHEGTSGRIARSEVGRSQ